MRVPQSYIQKVKVVGHVLQTIFIFVAAIMMIAVYAKGGENGGATGYYLALCFLSIPAIIYLVMVPMWTRAQRFANAYAFLAVDALYTIFWFAAAIAVAMYNRSGIIDGAKDAKLPDDQRNCTTFKYGSESKCNISKAAVGIGGTIFVLFAITAGISGYYMAKFRKEGVLPYEGVAADPHHLSGESAKDNAWSTEIETANNRDSMDSTGRHTDHGGDQQEDEYALLHSTETDEGRHPGRPLSWGEDRTGYGRPVPPYADYRDDGRTGAGGAAVAGADALSPGGYDDYRREAGAPAAGSGYSFGR